MKCLFKTILTTSVVISLKNNLYTFQTSNTLLIIGLLLLVIYSTQLLFMMKYQSHACHLFNRQLSLQVLNKSVLIMSSNSRKQATMSELRPSVDECQIPSEEDLINCTKQNPYNWNAVTSFRRGAIQPIESFHEQNFAIENCVQSIDRYRNLASTNFEKSITIRGHAGTGKSRTLQYCLAYALSKGLFCLTSLMMARRSVF